MSTTTKIIDATPAKLRDGSWGARVTGTPAPGATVRITAKSGKSWTATVRRIIWTDGSVSLCSTGSTGSADSAGNSIRSGASYRAGVTAPHGRTCPNCGSRECAKAWSRYDLCDED